MKAVWGRSGFVFLAGFFLGCGGTDPEGGSTLPHGGASGAAGVGVALPDGGSADAVDAVDAAGGAARPSDAATPHDAGFRDPGPADGACTSPNLVCNGACVAVDQDESNCGRCGNACAGPSAVCLAGQCGCAGAGLDYCVGVGCMDVTSDTSNCGACGNVCDPNQFTACQAGTCVP